MSYFAGIAAPTIVSRLANARRWLLLLMGLAALGAAFLVVPTTATASGRADGEISIPLLQASPQLDGLCDPSREYGTARRLSFAQDIAYLVHDGDALWICFDNLPDTLADAQASVRLDFDLGRLNPMQPDDLVLQVTHTGATRTLAGNGAGGMAATDAGAGRWDARYIEQRGQRSAEFRLDVDWLGGIDRLFGLSLGSETSLRRDIWPTGALPTSPTTWGRVILAGNGQQRTFSGQITYQARDGSVHPAPNVGVVLIGNNRAGREARVALVQTDAQGNYTLTSSDGYVTHRVELDTRTLPRGYQSLVAGAGTAGTVLDSSVIGFIDLPAGAYTQNNFLLGDTAGYTHYQDAVDYALRGPEGPYYLIIASRHVIDYSLGLQEFVQFKSLQGFHVEVVSLKQVDETYQGILGIPHRIRQLELDRRAVYGDRFQYLLLIGTQTQIPHVRLALNADEEPPCTSTGLSWGYKGNWKYSDWYYVDLVSNFDSNGNGCLADGVKGKDFAAGYTPDQGIQFAPTVAVGRIPFDGPNAVTQVLQNSMRMEKQGFSPKATLAMSAVALEGFTYDDKGNTVPCEGQWFLWSKCVPVDATRNYDGAVLGEAMKIYLEMHNFDVETLYEEYGAAAGSAGIAADQPMGALASDKVVANQIDGYAPGYVSLFGHGDGNGVYRTYWQSDNNHTGLYEYKPGDGGYTVEYGSNKLLTIKTAEEIQNLYSSLYFIAACSVADPEDYNGHIVHALMLSNLAAAAFAPLSIVTTGSWNVPADGYIQSTNYFVTRAALFNNLRFGDALWRTLSQRIATNGPYHSGEYATAYFGDPTLAYWGHPGAHSVSAPWAMLRQNPYGQSWYNGTGPGNPKEIWASAGLFSPAPADLPPPPVVDGDGRIYVGRGANLDVLSLSGDLLARLPLAAKAFGTAALAADDLSEVVYVVDVAGTLYSFRRFLFGQYTELWRLDLTGIPQTSPIVGSDGFISIAIKGTNGKSRLLLVRPTTSKEAGGYIFNQVFLEGDAIGATAAHPDRTVYATTSAGQLARYNPFSQPPIEPNTTTTSAFVTPPLLAKDALYAGRDNRRLVKMNLQGAELKSYLVSAPITAGPVMGPGGQIVIGTQDGILYSFTTDLALRWVRFTDAPILGAPAFTSDALYIVNQGGVHAYHPHSGEPLWSRPIAETVTGGSVAVGPNRHLIAYTNQGHLRAYGEGWMYPPQAVVATPIDAMSAGAAVNVTWDLPGGATAGKMFVAQAESVLHTTSYTPTAIVLQRSEEGGPWQSIATLPPNSTSYSDTAVTRNTVYAYRVQVVEAEGADSDFAFTAAPVRSLPDLPTAPTLLTAQAVSAEAISLTWQLAPDQVVISVRLERAATPAGPFAPVQTFSADVTSTVDDTLTPGTSYVYRLIAHNQSGASGASNMLNATTFAQSLPTPQAVAIEEQANGDLAFVWQGAKPGMMVVIEYAQGTFAGYIPLARVAADQPFVHSPDFEEPVNTYRLKFVQGENESPFVTVPVTQYEEATSPTDGSQIYLPVIVR